MRQLNSNDIPLELLEVVKKEVINKPINLEKKTILENKQKIKIRERQKKQKDYINLFRIMHKKYKSRSLIGQNIESSQFGNRTQSRFLSQDFSVRIENKADLQNRSEITQRPQTSNSGYRQSQRSLSGQFKPIFRIQSKDDSFLYDKSSKSQIQILDEKNSQKDQIQNNAFPEEQQSKNNIQYPKIKKSNEETDQNFIEEDIFANRCDFSQNGESYRRMRQMRPQSGNFLHLTKQHINKQSKQPKYALNIQQIPRIHSQAPISEQIYSKMNLIKNKYLAVQCNKKTKHRIVLGDDKLINQGKIKKCEQFGKLKTYESLYN